MRVLTSERLKRNTPPEWYQTAKKTMQLQQRLGLNIPILHDYATLEDSVRDLRLHEGSR